MKPVELLAPAGSPECLNAAVGEGADAVYLGLKDFNARLRSANFAYSQFEGALRTLHRMGRRVYVAVNTVFEQREADRMYQFLQYLSRTGPDGIIVQDLGTAKMAAECFPALDIHASTQMNVSSARAANLLSKHKVRRVVLARELSAAEITSVRQNTNVELETFVHGALCVSASGLCLFSSYLGGKSANRGMCTQACRRLYQSDGESSGYYFSLPDLQLLGEVKTLAAAGINALKIEGRMKSAEYVGAVTAAYRRVIDALDAPDEAYQAALSDGLRLLKGDFARSKTKYLFYPEASGEKETVVGHNEPPCTPPDWLCPQQSGGAGIFLGAITKTRGAGEDFMAAVPRPGMAAGGETAEMALEAGDSIRVHSGDDSRRVSHKVKRVYEQGGVLWLSAPEGAAAGDAVYVIQKKSKNKR
ncbi:MAG: U32 family peptidase, partial [Spirochaetaceae bacterium]|nr:U32 family peptidase [Spirochaetaceae bacterium]